MQVRIDKDLQKPIRIHAAKNDLTVPKVVNQAVRKELKLQKKK